MTRVTVDGNEAAVSVAYRLNEVCCIYPITPSSPMAELADEWSSHGRPNVWGTVPTVVEMQSEGRSGRRAARRAAERRPGDDVHRVAGTAADDPEHVQDRRRADLGRHPRRRPIPCSAGTFDLRRPLRRDGGAPDRLRPARRRLGAGGARPGAHRAGRDAAHPGAVPALLRRLPYLARAEHDRAALRRRPAGARAATSSSRRTAAARCHRSGRSSAARRRTRTSTSRPARRSIRSTRGPRRSSQELMAELGERTGRRLTIVDYTGHPEAERVLVAHGLGCRDRRRDRRLPLCGTGRTGRAADRPALPPVPGA